LQRRGLCHFPHTNLHQQISECLQVRVRFHLIMVWLCSNWARVLDNRFQFLVSRDVQKQPACGCSPDLNLPLIGKALCHPSCVLGRDVLISANQAQWDYKPFLCMHFYCPFCSGCEKPSLSVLAV
jgi:hypothetical protein